MANKTLKQRLLEEFEDFTAGELDELDILLDKVANTGTQELEVNVPEETPPIKKLG